MADAALNDLGALAETPANGDLLYIVDVSDTTDGAGGTNKKITRSNLVGGLAASAHTHLLAAGATDVTSSAAELNILDGATLSTAELNYVDGVTSAIQTQLDGKQASGATLTSLEGLSLTAGDVLYATGADTLARLPKGTADQVLTMNAGATAPEWADAESGGGGSTPADFMPVILFDGYSNPLGGTTTIRTETAGSGGAAYQTTRGVRLTHGTTANSYAVVLNSLYSNSGAFWQDSLYDRDLKFTSSLGASLDNYACVAFWGIGSNVGSGDFTTTSHKRIGFRATYNGAAIAVFAVTCNGTSETATDITSAAAAVGANLNAVTAPDMWHIVYDSGVNAKFYVNGTLCATITTNLPAGANDGGSSHCSVGLKETTGAETGNNYLDFQYTATQIAVT